LKKKEEKQRRWKEDLREAVRGSSEDVATKSSTLVEPEVEARGEEGQDKK
jgi:hypothetical protein